MLKKLDRTSAGVHTTRAVKVLQFGGGNFLRGFADWMIDVMNEKTDFNGCIDIVTSVTPGTAELINDQQGLYHLVQQGNKQGKIFSETRLITSVRRAINPATDYNAFSDAAKNPHLRFVISNTTEAGIVFDDSDNSADALPKSFPGKLTLLLHQRFVHFNGASDKTLIMMPCELIENNGSTLKQMVLRYASHWKLTSAFSDWVEKNIFCNTLVDRIVPGYPKENIQHVHKETGFDDKLVVAAEPFYFWAIEGQESVEQEFPARRADLNNVVFSRDISPYRVRKVRILNGAHTAMMAVAYLQGIRTVKEAMDHPVIEKFVRDIIENEIIPTLTLPKQELTDFANAVIDRFKNPFIKHLLLSISLNSISKFKVRVIPTIVDYLKLKKALPSNLIVSFAALLCFYRGRWDGKDIPLNDSPEAISIIQDAWKVNAIEDAVTQILSSSKLWDSDLTLIPGLSNAILQEVYALVKSQHFPE